MRMLTLDSLLLRNLAQAVNNTLVHRLARTGLGLQSSLDHVGPAVSTGSETHGRRDSRSGQVCTGHTSDTCRKQQLAETEHLAPSALVEHVLLRIRQHRPAMRKV